jgi:hypothetical protein
VRKILFAVALSTLFSILAHAEHVQTCNGGHNTVPDGLQIVCSATWQFRPGTCTGKDLWDQWIVTGQSPSDDAFIRPWADTPITVIGYELVKLQDDDRNPDSAYTNNHKSWFMIGSAISGQPDAMLWLAPGETHSQRMWPAGTGQLWPSKTLANHDKDADMLDLHGSCFGGGSVTIFLTIYYTPHE